MSFVNDFGSGSTINAGTSYGSGAGGTADRVDAEDPDNTTDRT